MIPKITFTVSKDTLKIRIKIMDIDPAVYQTGIFCPKEKFDSKKQICGYPNVQQYMEATADSIRKAYLPGATPESLWNEFLGRQKQATQTRAHTVKDAFEYYLKVSKVKEATKANKETLIEHLTIRDFYEKPLKDMNGAAFREFIGSLNLSESSTYATYVRLCTVFNRYIRDHALSISMPVGLYKAASRKELEQDEFLTWAELEKLLETPLTKEYAANNKMEIALDAFKFMALTGMAVGDVLKFDPAINIDGNWVKYKRGKTGSRCTIPLLPQTKQIIERNKWPLKISVRAIQNCCETVIGEMVGRKIKSHSGRKTFGAVCLELGYTLESTAAMLGHANPLITAQVYARVTKQKIEREMIALPDAVKKMMGIEAKQ